MYTKVQINVLLLLKKELLDKRQYRKSVNFHKPCTVIKTWKGSRKVVEVQGWKGVYWNDEKIKRDPRHFTLKKYIIFLYPRHHLRLLTRNPRLPTRDPRHATSSQTQLNNEFCSKLLLIILKARHGLKPSHKVKLLILNKSSRSLQASSKHLLLTRIVLLSSCQVLCNSK